MKSYNIIYLLLFLLFSSPVNCQNNNSANKLEVFLSEFYEASINRAIFSHTNDKTKRMFEEYYFKSYLLADSIMIDNYKCDIPPPDYEIIVKPNNLNHNEFKYDVIFGNDTIKDITLIKEKDDFKIALTHSHIMQLLFAEEKLYSDMLLRMFAMCDSPHIIDILPDICHVAQIWFTEEFYNEYQNPKINYLYGMFYMSDNNSQFSLEKSIKYLLKAYQEGYYQALDDLGMAYFLISQNEKFLEICIEGAKKGITNAEYHLGEYYLNKFYHKEVNSSALAIELFKKAAEKNHRGAQIELYNIYKRGIGVEKNIIEAEKWKKNNR